ncbi:MAG: flavin reductase family protein, partial [Paludibacteraceae bacterium]|nr:flavin reductase family protein [Paludibacteraceae bacterium]
CYVSIRPERHSYQIIKRTGEFVINLTSKSIAKATDWCGVRSGRDYNKFKEAHLTPQKTAVINSVYVEESPVAIECKVREIMKLGSHDMFIADVVNVLADDKYIDKETGKFELDKAELIAYSHGEYFTLGDMIGTFGWSVRKKNKKQRTK